MRSIDVSVPSVPQYGDHTLAKIFLTLKGLLCLVEILVKTYKDKPSDSFVPIKVGYPNSDHENVIYSQ